MADDLIRLCGLMIDAVGKGVACDGEANTGDPDDPSAHGRYMTGEAVQRYAREAVAEASSSGCDLERWTRPSPTGYVFPEGTGWTTGTGGTEAGVAAAAWRRSADADAARGAGSGVLRPTDAAPDHPGPDQPLTLPQRVAQAAHATGSVQPVTPHTWTPALDGDNRPLHYDHCGVCGVRKCTWLPGDATPACDWDVDCPNHGDVIAQGCGSGAVAAGLPDPEATQQLRVIPLHVAERLKQPLQPVAPDAHGAASTATRLRQTSRPVAATVAAVAVRARYSPDLLFHCNPQPFQVGGCIAVDVVLPFSCRNNAALRRDHTMTATATATAQATTTDFQAGDIVWGRPVREGKTQARRKGIVLGYFDQTGKDTTNLVVWWFGLGDASMDTTTLMFARELKKDGDIFNFGGHRALKLAKGCVHFSRARSVGWSLTSHGRRMRSIGA